MRADVRAITNSNGSRLRSPLDGGQKETRTETRGGTPPLLGATWAPAPPTTTNVISDKQQGEEVGEKDNNNNKKRRKKRGEKGG